MQTDFDILIIGGGMVGASLACALHASGLRIGVVEAVPPRAPAQPSYDDRSVTLIPGSRRIFEAIGVWGEIEKQGVTPIERMHISDRGHCGFARFAAADAGVPALGYVVENRALGAALWQAQQELKNVEWLCPATLESIEFRPETAVVAINQDGARRVLGARLVVAADGTDSPARAAAGIETTRTEYKQVAVVVNVTPGRPHANTAYERFTAAGPLALVPLRDGRCAVVWCMGAPDAEAILKCGDEEFLARLQERFGERLGRFTRPGRRAAYPLFLARARELARPRLALVGNAARTLHPIAAQGFNLGLRDVATLAEVVPEAARAARDIGDHDVMRRYAERRRWDNLATVAFTDGLLRIFSNDFPPLVLARDLGLIAVDLLPPVKRALVQLAGGQALWQ